ncbi:endonuclease/exonuclease/phosphatase family protein [Brevundimonas sp. SORGH_AS_0993]|uniref:endonuclease/exonuclease/phosphatase family protein n=1 Tax=Brevundimonas sp. SORGH_AS_0993 TaxID=3041794 RepID=UPI002786713B|nr:endonuclease/exonuclease/phosphatase family protein [Brevundimonas sp. SORGH_AS_0993]MDQ1154019.1 endonuclease/exonuclease/phosphatase (EEP) superfamily protein YafD [Brevundimonas sp. SORGH_AS_0993]
MSLLKTAANLAAGLTLLGLATIAAAALGGIGHRWVDILAQFTAPALTAALGVTLICLLLRLWPAAGTGALACGVLLLAVWPQGFPPRAPLPQPDQPVVRVYSANLWVYNADVQAMRRSIVAADPDIVMLVEMGAAPAAQADALLAGYPYRTDLHQPDRGREARSVVASRYPIAQPLPSPPDGLSTVGAVVQTPLGPLDVFAVHLTRPWPYQYQWGQISQVMALTERRRQAPPHPVIAAGDFNSVSSARIGRQIQADMKLIPAPGWPGTWPTRLPAFAGLTIDQVYYSPELALVSRRLGQPTGSDHRPVVTQFTRAAP